MGLGLGEGEAATRPAAHATKGRCSPSDCAITPPSAGPMAKLRVRVRVRVRVRARARARARARVRV